MPEANRFLLHVMAAVAEHEARAISDRTKAALEAAKARGVALGASNRGEPTGQWAYVDARPRKDGGAVVKRGWVTVIEVEIDGPEMAIPEAVRYALTWQEMLPKSGRG